METVDALHDAPRCLSFSISGVEFDVDNRGMAVPDPRVIEQFRRLLGPRFEELAGAHMSGEVPLTETLINAVIAERLRAAETPIESAEIQVRPDGELFARLRPRRAFLPAIIVGARIEQQPDLPRSAVLGLRWWLPGAGALAALAAPVLGFLKAGPPWVSVEGERVYIDVARLLRDQGAGEVLTHLKSIRVGSRDGALIVGFEVEVRRES
jgi:hypothetical protein